MGIFDKFFGKNHEPDVVIKGKNGGIDLLYYNVEDTISSVNAFRNANEFIAREFTKVIFSLTDVPNELSTDYMLSVKPNENQTSNEWLYEFAKSLLTRGSVWFKVKQTQKMVTSIEFSRTEKAGFREFEAQYLKMKVPTTLLDQYDKTLSKLSSTTPTTAIEINTKLNAQTEGEDVAQKMAERLQLMREQMQKYGGFVTLTNEASTEHPNSVKPDSAVLGDIKQMIYEQLNVNPDVLTGKYNEVDYRAFYATHIQPISSALEDFLNQIVLTEQAWKAGARIEVIMDLLQFATLADYTNFTDKMLRSTMLMPDEGRRKIGMKNLPDGIGRSIFATKNYVILNNEEMNDVINNGVGGTNNEGAN